MARGRYKADYRLVETLDERGRVRTVTEYMGKPYRFTDGVISVRKRLVKVALAVLLGWIAFVWGFVPDSVLSRSSYIALPRAFGAIPLMLITDTAFSAFTWKEPFERRQADKINEVLPASCGGLMVLSALVIITGIIRLAVSGGAGTGDVQFLLSTAVMMVCGVFAKGQKVAATEDEMCSARERVPYTDTCDPEGVTEFSKQKEDYENEDTQ